MKKLILATLVAIAGWCAVQAQSMPAPEKYNDYLEQVSQMADMGQQKAEFLMNATMEALVDDASAYRKMMELAERRFSDPADPIHNEGLYMAVLKHTTEHYVLSTAEREKQRLLLEGAKKNMPGTVAADFDYITPSDKTVHHLNELNTDYILIYFNNPDCESCEAVKERLATNELINQMVNDKQLTVLAIYPYDDNKLWKKAKYPKMMINGWNQSHNIEYGELYDLPTLPCFYLLDKEHKVLIKNEGSLNKVEAKLKSLTQPEATTAAPQPKSAAKQKPRIPKMTDASPDDPNTVTSERIMQAIINNQSADIYNSMSEEAQATGSPDMFANMLSDLETRCGKFQNHGAWKTMVFQGKDAYTSVMTFEKIQLNILLFYDEAGKLSSISLAPTPQERRLL